MRLPSKTAILQWFSTAVIIVGLIIVIHNWKDGGTASPSKDNPYAVAQ